MEVLYTALEVRNLTARLKNEAGRLGFVPTMGALHEGHLELVRQAKSENSVVVCSIFVNPAQFNNPEDLERYPRTLEKDSELLRSVGCDILFVPSVMEMYPSPLDLRIDFGMLETVMEGAFRPGHFNGVGIVVAKLFNIVQPDRAYFGQKDLQQTAIIKSLIRNLSYPVELRICPTVREPDGLAMSSRNVRLTPEERKLAPEIYRILTECKMSLQKNTPVKQAIEDALAEFARLPAFRTEYLELADTATLTPADTLRAEGNNALCVAVRLGKVRLIDNLVF
ncbi:MAG: pantoate--beta-alanine ligase [Cytophagaceae bacterium SCN 52-12]|nr:MAG: pantoate--beta-alanine ligase [Cytophagaceae bacterium SCN 52-12]